MTTTYFFPAEISPTPFSFRALFWTVPYSDIFPVRCLVFLYFIWSDWRLATNLKVHYRHLQNRSVD